MYRDFGTVFFAVMLGIVMVAIPLVISWLIAPSNKTKDKLDTYECGEEPDGDAWIQFHPRYYVVALVFVVFDAEAAFLFPWALSIRELGSFAVIEMFVFLGVLFFGWLYAWKKGALRWQ